MMAMCQNFKEVFQFKIVPCRWVVNTTLFPNQEFCNIATWL